ncbi:unnamed protein product [Staurois parvus]|uniref:Uncharacterized protein n=1 Tax=Staurois parvus TaxID=386267 RepID=A0ABN9AKV0_9NEOB|nr:unnamed protein product [Staurois parvus]
MISVAPAVPINASCHCPSMPPASASSMPHISAYQCTLMPHQCPSELPFSVTHQCHLSVPVSAAYQCHI